MPAAPGPTSLAAVATAAGVSAMTVSRVLRNSPQVSATMRARVLRAARQLSYQPNPQVARLMEMVRGAKARRVRATLGVIRDDIPDDELHDRAYQYVAIADIRTRAAQHGYQTEEFFLGRNGLTPARLGGIRQARGIEEIIVSPQSSRILTPWLRAFRENSGLIA
jgi:DNA-binding LacI/PurR family transcriptional regulator